MNSSRVDVLGSMVTIKLGQVAISYWREDAIQSNQNAEFSVVQLMMAGKVFRPTLHNNLIVADDVTRLPQTRVSSLLASFNHL